LNIIFPGKIDRFLEKNQIFSFLKFRENITNDIYLQSQMDADNYVPISLIASFKLIKSLTHDLQLITDILKGQ